MVIVHNKRKRKPTGGRYKDVRSKKLSQKGTQPSRTKLGDKKVKTKTTRGGNIKHSLVSDNKVHLTDPKSKKSMVAELQNVEENPASRHFVRRNIITKGAIIQTDKGKAKVTNRPGQEGVINAILVE
ncbi:30S ribosomal protein S8e [Nanoarchaeota archaeon]